MHGKKHWYIAFQQWQGKYAASATFASRASNGHFLPIAQMRLDRELRSKYATIHYILAKMFQVILVS